MFLDFGSDDLRTDGLATVHTLFTFSEDAQEVDRLGLPFGGKCIANLWRIFVFCANFAETHDVW